jgi:hypothetical protein
MNWWLLLLVNNLSGAKQVFERLFVTPQYVGIGINNGKE